MTGEYLLRLLRIFNPKLLLREKFPDKVKHLNLKLLPTVKLIDEVRKKFPALKMITFKYEENISHDELLAIAQKRFSKKGGSQLIVANRREEFKPDGNTGGMAAGS